MITLIEMNTKKALPDYLLFNEFLIGLNLSILKSRQYKADDRKSFGRVLKFISTIIMEIMSHSCVIL